MGKKRFGLVRGNSIIVLINSGIMVYVQESLMPHCPLVLEDSNSRSLEFAVIKEIQGCRLMNCLNRYKTSRLTCFQMKLEDLQDIQH